MADRIVTPEMLKQRLEALHDCFFIRDPDKTLAETAITRLHEVRESFNHTCDRFGYPDLIVRDDMVEFEKELAASAELVKNGLYDELRNTIHQQRTRIGEQSVLIGQQAVVIESFPRVVQELDYYLRGQKTWAEDHQNILSGQVQRIDGMAKALYDQRNTTDILEERIKKLERGTPQSEPPLIIEVASEVKGKKRKVKR